MGEITIDWEEGTYTGEVSNNVPNGQGTYTSPDGMKYVGEWKDGKYHGQGTYIFGSGPHLGDIYVGEWKDNKKHGQGTYTFASGSKYVGEFKDGNPWKGTEYDKDGTVITTYSEGVETKI